MAKIKTGPIADLEAPKGDREARWAQHVEAYKKENPVKWASKNARGEFDKVPASFK